MPSEAPRPASANVPAPARATLVGPLTELLRVVEGQQPGMVSVVLVADPYLRHVHAGASPSLPDDLVAAIESIEIGPSTCSWGAAIHGRQRVIVEDTATHPLWFRLRRLALDHGLRSSLAEPILSPSGHPLGVLVAFRRRVHLPGAVELELVASAAHMAGLAIERAAAHERDAQRLAEDSGHLVVWSHAEANGSEHARAA